MAPFLGAGLALPLALLQLAVIVSAQASTLSRITLIQPATRQPTVTTSPPEPSASSSARPSGPQVHTVKVANGDHKFQPEELKDVGVGDIITFEFYPQDHSVARAEFEKACVPYEYTGPGKTGFWSGTQLVDDPQRPLYWNLTINSTEPIFYYCGADGSCKNFQMIGVINPNDTQTLTIQKEAAKNAAYMVRPGEPIPAEGTKSLEVPQATGSNGVPPASHGQHSSKLSTGAIAGIVVGGVAFLAMCAALFFYVGRAKSLKEVLKRHDATGPRNEPTPHNDYGAPPSAYPGNAFSPTARHSDYGGVLPAYGQHQVAEQYPTGWGSPNAGYMPVSSQPQMADVKGPNQPQPLVAEMQTPDPNEHRFTAELEAPGKAPR